MTARATLSLLPLILLPAACATTSPPQLRLVDTRIEQQTADGAVVMLQVEATNPNPYSIALGVVEYALAVDGRTVSRGVRDAQRTLQRFGSQTLFLPAGVPAPFSIEGRPCRAAGEVIYVPPSALARTLLDMEVSVTKSNFAGTSTLAAH